MVEAAGCWLIVGAVGTALTVSVALLLAGPPAMLRACTSTVSPEQPSVRPDSTIRRLASKKATLPRQLPAFAVKSPGAVSGTPPMDHVMLMGSVPETPTVNVALPPAEVVCGVSGAVMAGATDRARTASVTTSLHSTLANPCCVTAKAMVVPFAVSGTVVRSSVSAVAPPMVAPARPPRPAPLLNGVPLQLRPVSGRLRQVTP